MIIKADFEKVYDTVNWSFFRVYDGGDGTMYQIGGLDEGLYFWR